jgi:hypothetical protein
MNKIEASPLFRIGYTEYAGSLFHHMLYYCTRISS